MPVVVPKNVTIEGATAGAPSTVDVPTDETGFTLAADASGLSNLILDGTGLAGSTGIVATTGSGATTTLTNVTVKNMGLDGIDVSHTGKLSIGTGVSSSTNGVGAAHSGLVVQDNGICTITVNTGGTAATFSHNTQFGISVLGAGSITIGGTLNPAAVASSNSDAGLYIVQTPGNGVPANTVSNFASNTSLKGNGIHVYGGSSLKLRNSVTQGNPADGIEIQTYVNGTTTSDDVTHIDLGTAADAGGNTFQYATGAMPNANTRHLPRPDRDRRPDAERRGEHLRGCQLRDRSGHAHAHRERVQRSDGLRHHRRDDDEQDHPDEVHVTRAALGPGAARGRCRARTDTEVTRALRPAR